MSMSLEYALPPWSRGTHRFNTRFAPGCIWERGSQDLLRRDVKRFRGGLVFKEHRLVYHPTLGGSVIKKRRRRECRGTGRCLHLRITLPTGPSQSRKVFLIELEAHLSLRSVGCVCSGPTTALHSRPAGRAALVCHSPPARSPGIGARAVRV